MKYTNIAGHKTLNSFVEYKINLLKQKPVSFETLFELMFSEKENVFYEYDQGFKQIKITYGESYKHIKQLAASFKKETNLNHNSIIGIYLDNDITWLETFWALLMSGYRPLLLNLKLSDDSLEEVIKTSKCECVISNGKKFSVPSLNIKDIELKEEIDKYDFSDEIFFVSSGTSNNVKVCAYTSKEITNIVLKAKDIVFGNSLIKKHYDGELKLLALLPFYHIFGFVAVYTWFSFFSRTFVELKDLSPKNVVKTITSHKVTHIFAVPLFWQKTYEAAMKEIKSKGDKTYKKFSKGLRISNKLGSSLLGKFFRKTLLKQVRTQLFGDSPVFLISGGSVIDNRVLEFFNGIGYHLTNGYGMTEIGISSFEMSNKFKYLNSASIGKPLFGYEYKIGESGNLLVKGNSLAAYVLVNGKRIDNENDWFDTKDLVSVKNGHYYITGREDDLIVPITGENINPNIVEASIKSGDTKEVCLIRGKENELPTLLVEVNRYLSNEKVEEVTSNIKERIRNNNLSSQIGRVILVKDNLIDNDDFKLNRKKVEKKFYSGQLRTFDKKENVSSSDLDEVTNKVKEIFSNTLNHEVNNLDGDIFLDLGGTSLDYFAIVSLIHDEFGVDIYSVANNSLTSINSISEYIKSKL